MPLRLADLRQQTKTIEVTFAGETVMVTYRQHAVTPTFLDGLSRTTSRPVAIVAALVVAWDVLGNDEQPVPLKLGEDGQPTPATLAALAELPLPFLDEVGGAILADLSPKARGAR